MQKLLNFMLVLGAVAFIVYVVYEATLPQKETSVLFKQNKTTSLIEAKDGYDVFRFTKKVTGTYEQNILFIDPKDNTFNLATLAMINDNNSLFLLSWFGNLTGNKIQDPVEDVIINGELPDGLYRITAIGISDDKLITDMSFTEVSTINSRLNPSNDSKSIQVRLICSPKDRGLLEKLFELNVLVYKGNIKPTFG